MSHQSDWMYYKQPIKVLVVKVNGMLGDFLPIKNRHTYSSITEEEVFIYWAYFDVFCGFRRGFCERV